MLIAVGGVTFLLEQAALVGELSTVDEVPRLMLIMPSAIWLFARPMWGIRGAIIDPLIRHRERILAVTEWPVTSCALWRPTLYFVIPPLAWFAAALVENLVDAAL